jgi:hypothetical protein
MPMRRAVLCSFVALIFGALGPHGAQADTLSVDDLLGRWCGVTTDYEFTRERLTVHVHQGGDRVLPVRSFDVRGDEIKVYWDIKRPDLPQDDIATVFYDFDAAHRTMAQKANTSGDLGPRIPFHRC